MLTVLLPVTREWTRELVCAAIKASDIPRGRLILIVDAPGCEAWEQSLTGLGFAVEVRHTHNDDPPAGRLERRARHRAMRRLSQRLVPDGLLLSLEDDVLVPPDVYARLSAVGPHVTAAIRGRWGGNTPVVYPLRGQWGRGVEAIEGCGYNCLLTTGEAYKAAGVRDLGGPADYEHTVQIRPLYVDWDCVCGHMTEHGVLMPGAVR